MSRLQDNLTGIRLRWLLGSNQKWLEKAVDLFLCGCQGSDNVSRCAATDAFFRLVQVACGVPKSDDQMRFRKSTL